MRTLADLWDGLGQLDEAGIALATASGSIRSCSAPDHRVGFLDFANAEAMAATEAHGRRTPLPSSSPTAAIVGPHTGGRRAIEACGPDRVAALLPLIQPQVLPTVGPADPKRTKGDLKGLRLAAAGAAGIPPVEPQPLARVQLAKLLLLAGTFFGIWLLVEQLVGLQASGTCSNANWWWFLAVLLDHPGHAATEAVSMSGAMAGSPPIGPLTMLRLAMNFTGMIGGTVADDSHGRPLQPASGSAAGRGVSSGLIYSVTGFIVQIVLTLSLWCSPQTSSTGRRPDPRGRARRTSH